MVDAGGEGCNVSRVDGREHPHSELVAAELAVGVGVEHAVGPKDLADRGGGDALVEVDGADDR